MVTCRRCFCLCPLCFTSVFARYVVFLSLPVMLFLCPLPVMLFFCLCPLCCFSGITRTCCSSFCALAQYVRQLPLDVMFRSRQRLPAKHETRCLQEERGGGRLKRFTAARASRTADNMRVREREGCGEFRYMMLLGAGGGWCRCGGGRGGRSARLRGKSVRCSAHRTQPRTVK
jgi:hypothetical protein